MADYNSSKDVPLKNEIESIVEHMRKPVMDRINDRHFISTPPGWGDAQEINTDQYLPNPARKKGSITLTDVGSFIRFIKDQGSLASCRIYVNANYAKGEASIVAVLNDHDDQPQWRDYRVILAPTFSEEWKLWKNNNGKDRAKAQAEFASFLEDNLKDIAPGEGEFASGSDIYKMAIEFEARREIYVKSDIRSPTSGTIEFTYSEKEDGTTIAKIKMFERFRIGIRVFQNGKAYAIDVKLRNRYPNGKLSFWYDLERPDVILETAMNEMIEQIQKESGFPVYFGNPG